MIESMLSLKAIDQVFHYNVACFVLTLPKKIVSLHEFVYCLPPMYESPVLSVSRLALKPPQVVDTRYISLYRQPLSII